MIKLIGNEKIKNIIYRRYLKDCCLVYLAIKINLKKLIDLPFFVGYLQYVCSQKNIYIFIQI